MRVAIIANGEFDDGQRLRDLWQGAEQRIAADGGAVNARKRLGVPPQVVIGDMDSLDDATREWCERASAEFVQHPRAKDKADLELALDLATARGASEIVILGALGGRFDQTMANVLLLVKAAAAHVVARISGARFDAWVAWEGVVVNGRVGETVSLIPLTERVDGIVTQGLLYPLRGETLWLGSSRGVSNELVAERAAISFTSGVLLVVHLLDAGS